MQGVLARLPAPTSTNFVLQRLSGGLPLSTEKLFEAREIALRHVDAARRHASQNLGELRFFEFGAGWDLHVPILFYLAGVDEQIVVDLNRLVRPDLVEHVCRLTRDLPNSTAVRQRPIPTDQTLLALVAAMGIDYRAPADARATGLADASVDVVTSTNTMEHIPPADLATILAELRRIVRPTGVLSLFIDYQDHYSYFDGSISVYNFLSYTDRQWRRYNNDLHFQNRLRHDDYLRLVRQAGFEIVEEEPRHPSAGDLEVLRTSRLAEPFAAMAPERVGIRSSRLTCKPR